MQYIHGIILGLIQGLTEFLPISSSGHLFVVSFLFKDIASTISDTSYLWYTILLHLATLCAVLVFSYKIVFNILKACFNATVSMIQKKPIQPEDRSHTILAGMLIMSTLVTVVVALAVNSIIELFFQSIHLPLVMSGFFVTIVFLFLSIIFTSKKYKTNEQKIELGLVQKIQGMSHKKIVVAALLIGFMQGIAVVPGISRSGITIVIALFFGFSFVQAARYSFLLSIPAILGAFVLGLGDISSYNISTTVISMGMISAFVSGLFGLIFLFFLAKKQKIWFFAIYLCLLEITLLLTQF